MALNAKATTLINNLGLQDSVRSDMINVINASSQLTQQMNDYATRGGLLTAGSSGAAGDYKATVGDNTTGGQMTIATDRTLQNGFLHDGFSLGYSLAETLAHELGHAFDQTLGTANLPPAGSDPLGSALIQTRSEAVAEVNSYSDMSQARAALTSTNSNVSASGSYLIDPSTHQVTNFTGAESAIRACLSNVGSGTNTASSGITVPAQCVDAAEAALARDAGPAYLSTYYEKAGGTGGLPNREVVIDQNGSTTVSFNTDNPSVLTYTNAAAGTLTNQNFGGDGVNSFSLGATDYLNGNQTGQYTYNFESSSGTSLLLTGGNYSLTVTQASVNIAGGASATISGGSNRISVGDSNSSLVDNGSADSTVLTGSGEHAVINGSNDTANSTGVNDLISLYGTQDTSTVSGDTSWTDSYGASNSIWINGNNDSSTAFAGATNNTITSSGANDGTYLREQGAHAIVNGSNSWADSFSSSDLVQLYGTGERSTINGNGSWSDSYGGGNQIWENGNNDKSTAFTGATNNTITSNGTSDGTYLREQNGHAVVNGDDSWADSFSSNDLAQLYGQGERSTINGNGSYTDSYGSGNQIWENGNNDASTAFAGATSNSITSSGTGDGTYLREQDSHAIVNGSNSWADSFSTGDLVQLYGRGNRSTINGDGSWSDSYGSGNEIWEDGEHDAATDFQGATNNTINGNGNHDGIWLRDNNDTAIVNGNYDTTSAYGKSDVVRNLGSDDRAISYGDDDYTYNANSSDSFDNEGSGDTWYGGFDSGDFGGYGGYGGYYGYYGLAGTQTTVAAAVGSDIGAIAAQERSIGNFSASVVAQTGHQQVVHQADLYAETGGVTGSVLEAGKWDKRVVTWSLASAESSRGSQFSSSMDSSYEVAVVASFDALSKASGITFKEVADSTSSNIRIGFSELDTENSGIVGYTTLKLSDGNLQSAVIRLEDPSQTQLNGITKATSVYAGTDAQFQQVLEHEIGHAVGLGDNADPTSIMFYELTGNNRQLDSTDLSGLKSLYGGTKSQGSLVNVQSLTQAMSSFEVPPAVHSMQVAPDETHWRSTQLLGAARRMAV